jgi:hypothetical protein
VRCHGNKVSTINGVIFLSSLSLSPRRVTFLPEGVIVGFQNFGWGFNSQKNKIWGEKKIRWTPLQFFSCFLGENEKCLQLPEMAGKLIGKMLSDYYEVQIKTTHL